MHTEFNKEINYIKNERIRNSLITILDLLPDYFYHIPASSTGKYHPEFTLGDKGLVRHTKVAVRIAYELLQDSAINNFTSDEKDLLLFALTIHDGLKNGINHDKYTAFDHPLQISKFVRDNKDKLELTDDELNLVCSCVETHMGPWTTDYNGNEVLQRPKTKYQCFVHMADYLASRKFLNIKFENNDIAD